jgi:hypothetical protein
MPLARASELDRLLICPGAAFLPNSEKTMGQAAEWGKLVHKWKVNGQIPESPLSPTLTKKLKSSGVNLLNYWPSEGKHEITFAFNVMNGDVAVREERSGLGWEDVEAWKLGFGDEWVVGTADYAYEQFGVPWIDDLKTGRLAAFSDYRAQQYFYGLAFARLLDAPELLLTITHWPKYPLHKLPHRGPPVEFADYMMEEFWGELKQLRETILYGRETRDNRLLQINSKCGFCPALANCPKYNVP